MLYLVFSIWLGLIVGKASGVPKLKNISWGWFILLPILTAILYPIWWILVRVWWFALFVGLIYFLAWI